MGEREIAVEVVAAKILLVRGKLVSQNVIPSVKHLKGFSEKSGKAKR